MAKDNIRKASKLAAVAIATAGAGLVVAAPAQAAPGNCEQWGFSGATNIKLSTGPMVSFDSGESSRVDNAVATDARKDFGRMNGGIEPNGFLLLTYKSEAFPDDPLLVLRGDVTPDGKARGTFNAKLNGTWELATPLKCMTPAAGGAGQGGNSKEVTADVDAYDAPGGTGNVVGMLRGGEHVNLGSGCRDDNWCNVSFPAGPGGTAWVWGDFLK